MEAADDFNREELEQLIEEKVLEFARDPDSTLELREEFIETVQQRQKEEATISHEDIQEEFG
jgi:hypothetical protein